MVGKGDKGPERRARAVAIGFDPSLLLSYYNAKLPLAPSSSASSGVKGPITPWDLGVRKPPQERRDVEARSSEPYFDPKNPMLRPAASASTNHGSQLAALLASRLSNSSGEASSVAADNDRLFALYKALDRLDYLARMANREGAADGLRPGIDADFQDGLGQVLSFVRSAPFANLTVLAGRKTATVQSSVAIAYPKSSYQGGAIVGDGKVFDAVPGVSASHHFTISITKAGVTTDVEIDLGEVTGTLNLDNINAHINQKLAAAGFATRFSRVQTGGSILDRTATWGEKIEYGAGETVTLSSPQATAAIYLAGSTGRFEGSFGRLIKLSGLDATSASTFSADIKPDSGTASAKATAVDGDGNVYVIGTTTGSFGSQLNQGSEDVYLTKYDSAGNRQWTRLLGAADSAVGFALAVDPSSGGVVVAGRVTGDLLPAAIGGGADSFVAKYDEDGTQLWLRQAGPATDDAANALSVDASGNIYVAGQVKGSIAAGESSAGGQDAYVTKLSSSGALLYHRQFGTAGTDAAIRTAIAADGNLIVASVEDGRAILAKYDASDSEAAPIWRIDLGALQEGGIGGLAVANGKVYVSGTTANAALDAGGAAQIARPASGGVEAFVFAALDSGASATPDFVSYVGTAASDQGAGVAVAGGKIYVTGTTTGTFDGQTRAVADAPNMFLAELDASGALNWARQYGGHDGMSRGFAIAADEAGASVLDALKLPRGRIDTHESNAIEAQTTARPGDYFTLRITDKTGSRSVKITIAKGETLRSLALKINGALLFSGKATALPVQGGQALKIAVNEGVTLQLIAGPKDFDALAGLGLKPQTLTNDGTGSANEAEGGAREIIGLGIDEKLNLLTERAASHAHVVLMGAMALVKQAYNRLNGIDTNPTEAKAASAAPAYLRTRIANYETALAWLNSRKPV